MNQTTNQTINRNRFRVGTFNVWNLALPNVTFYGHSYYTSEVYRQKTSWIAEQLTRMKADLVGFQEVFHVQALADALAESKVYESATTIAATPNGEGPVVALCSRLPVLEHRIVTTFPESAKFDVGGVIIPLDRFSRSVLSARIALSDTVECMVFVVHLKSKRPIFPEGVDRADPIEKAKGQARSLIMRAAETTALRVLLMEVLRDRNYPVIVLGDVNDNALAVTTQILSGEPPLRHFESEQKREIWDVLLYNVKDIQARRSYGDFYYTHIHNSHYESLDHILVSQEFVVENPKRIARVGHVSVFNDHLVDEAIGDEQIKPWQSDHGQVDATFELKR